MTMRNSQSMASLDTPGYCPVNLRVNPPSDDLPSDRPRALARSKVFSYRIRPKSDGDGNVGK